MAEFFRAEPITYREEGFNDFLIREFDWDRILSPKETMMGAPTELRVPGGDIDWPEFDIPPSTPYEDQQVKGQGAMSIGGSISNGTDLALPNLSVEADRLDAFELYASVKTISSGTIVFTVNITKSGSTYSIGSVLVSIADSKFSVPISATLLRDDVVSVDVSGTYTGGEDATIGIGVKQGVDPVV